jgi:hypothetical protein
VNQAILIFQNDDKNLELVQGLFNGLKVFFVFPILFFKLALDGGDIFESIIIEKFLERLKKNFVSI